MPDLPLAPAAIVLLRHKNDLQAGMCLQQALHDGMKIVTAISLQDVSLEDQTYLSGYLSQYETTPYEIPPPRRENLCRLIRKTNARIVYWTRPVAVQVYDDYDRLRLFLGASKIETRQSLYTSASPLLDLRTPERSDFCCLS